jgi:hypothetical protein
MHHDGEEAPAETPPPRLADARLLLARLLLLCAALVLAAVGGEVALRLVGYQSRSVYTTRLSHKIVQNLPPGIPYLHEPEVPLRQEWPSDPHDYFDGPRNQILYRVNNAGFRGRDFRLERGDAVRVAFLGDSFCWGHGVKEEDHFIVLLEERLRGSELFDGRFELYNFGMSAYNTTHEVALLKSRVLAYRPDVSVLWYFLNDAADEGTMAFMGGNNLLPEYRKKSRLLDAILYPIDSRLGEARMVRHYSSSYRPGAKQLRRTRRALKRFAQICKREGIIPVLAVHPVLLDLGPDYPFLEAHRTILSLAQRLGITAFDLLPHYEGHSAESLWVHPVDQHPNHIAHRLIADGFYDDLVSVIREHEVPIRRSLMR